MTTRPEEPTDRGAAPSRDRPIVAVHGVSFGYGRERVLENVSLAIEPRDFLAIIGPNGGGKTTLLKLILGLLKPKRGTIEHRLPRRRGAIGYVPQFAGFDKGFPLRVADIVRMGRLGRRGVGRRFTPEDDEAVEAMLARFRLADLARSPIDDLSGGQLQRTLIARALVSQPEILFLDEPLASIDSVSRDILMRTLAELHEKIPVVVVTHDLTPFSSLVGAIACVNRSLHYHPSGEVEAP